MNLREYQRAVVEASFALEPSEQKFGELGDAARFRLYRHMIRTRFQGMAEIAFKETRSAVGEGAFTASFARYLAEEPPKSALLRDVIAAFAPYAQRDRALLAAAPPFASDLLAFEHAKWCLAYQSGEQPAVGERGVRELDFAGVPVLNPVLARLSLGHAVHELEGGACQAKPTPLLVYRPPRADEVRWYACEPLFFALLQRCAEQPGPLADKVREVAGELGRAIDEALLESLATSLTLALERGVLLGSR